MITREAIEETCREIVERYHPEKVILFGSYADGTPREGSDVDLLVVMPFEGSEIQKTIEMRLHLRPKFPLDLMVRTPARIRDRLAIDDPFVAEIMRRGRTLYEASRTRVD
ncbi:nucleotidyltransferase domain-containing protein [candidate division KSB1 bacterium]|nr:nucleotidyltransferase domain-containing protein [candidate division KSB1 bacterium]